MCHQTGQPVVNFRHEVFSTASWRSHDLLPVLWLAAGHTVTVPHFFQSVAVLKMNEYYVLGAVLIGRCNPVKVENNINIEYFLAVLDVEMSLFTWCWEVLMGVCVGSCSSGVWHHQLLSNHLTHLQFVRWGFLTSLLPANDGFQSKSEASGFSFEVTLLMYWYWMTLHDNLNIFLKSLRAS